MKKIGLTLAAIAVVTGGADAQQGQATQEARAVLERVSRQLGVPNLGTIEYTGSGNVFLVGQAIHPDSTWPRFNLIDYRRIIDLEGGAAREETVRTQAYNPPRGGGVQPVVGEQRQIQYVSGDRAWNVMGETATPALAAAGERTVLGVWSSPQGFVRAAMDRPSTATMRTVDGRRYTVITFFDGFRPVSGYVSASNEIERVESYVDNPVLGAMPVATSFSNYRSFNGVRFPTRIVQRQGGHPVLEVNVANVRPNAPASLAVPENVRTATLPATPPVPQTQSEQLAPGVWYITGGSHHSIAVEFADHVAVVEAPQNEARALAVMAEVRRILPNKPIRYVVNSHHHFDHSGGLRAFAGEGVTIVTHAENEPYLRRALTEPRTLSTDPNVRPMVTPTFLPVRDRHVLSDATRTLELHHIQGHTHSQTMLMAYLPQSRILVQADAYTPLPEGAAPPATPNPFHVMLHDNIQRLGLQVDQIAPLHGRAVPFSEFLRTMGRAE
jgi:glyoxylase-like metal-dependent hydrolase (beta-lactamase superfamily II)